MTVKIKQGTSSNRRIKPQTADGRKRARGNTGDNRAPGSDQGRPAAQAKGHYYAESAKPNQLPEEFSKFGFKSDEELMGMLEDIDPDKVTHKYDADQKRAQLLLMHRMLIRRSTVDEICENIGVTRTRYYQLRKKLDSMIRLDIKRLDLPYYIGDTLALYDEVRSMALVASSNRAIKDTRVKLQAMQVALQAEREKNAFLQQCGVYSGEISQTIRKALEVFGSIPNVVTSQDKDRQEADDVLTDAISRLRSHNQAVHAQREEDAKAEDAVLVEDSAGGS